VDKPVGPDVVVVVVVVVVAGATALPPLNVTVPVPPVIVNILYAPDVVEAVVKPAEKLAETVSGTLRITIPDPPEPQPLVCVPPPPPPVLVNPGLPDT